MKKLISAFVSLLCIVSCSREKFAAEEGITVDFVGYFDCENKTILDGVSVNWLKDDPISIFDGNNPVQATASESGPSASFSATLTTPGPWYAVFPANSDATVNNDVITTTVPSSTTAKDNSFSKKANVTVAFSTSDNKLYFKNTLSFFKFTIGQQGIASVTLKGNSGEKLAGTVQIKYNDGVPQTTVVGDASTTSSLLPYNRSDIKTDVGCYIGFVPTTFESGFTLVYKDVYGDEYEIPYNGKFVAERSKIYNIGTPDSKFVVDGNIVFEDPDVKADIVKKFGTDGELKKSQAAAVTYEQFASFTFTDKLKVNKFNELKYFTGLYVNPIPGESRDGTCVPSEFFSGFTALEEVTLPSNVSEIRPKCFLGCSALKSIVIPSTVKGIWTQAFNGCSSLSGNLVIPEGVNTVSSQAFYNCVGLTGLSLPSTLKQLKSKAFSGLTNVKGTVVLPEALTTIPEYAFYGLQSVTKLVLPSKLASLGDQVFWALRAATCVGPEGTPDGWTVIPGTLKGAITAYCFCDEYYIHTLKVEEGPTSIAKDSFRKFGKNIAAGIPIRAYFPSTLTTIADKAFEEAYFNTVVFAGTTPPTISGNPFYNAPHLTDKTLKIFVPASAVSTYKKAWTALADYIYSVDEKSANYEVKGNLIDIRSLYNKEDETISGVTTSAKRVYPQNTDYSVPDEMVAASGNALQFAVSLHKSRGPEALRSFDAGAKPRIAAAVSSISGWTDTGKSFVVGNYTYHVFTKDDYAVGEWLEVPDKGEVSTIVFGETVKVSGCIEYGKTLAHCYGKIRSTTINNVCFAILPDGSYIAGCSASEYFRYIGFFKSYDKGETWIPKYGNFEKSKNLISNYPTLFVLNGKLYLIGTGPDSATIRICRSDDGGMNWTVADSKETGILFDKTLSTASNQFHAAPGAAVAICNGRIYTVWEEYVDWDKKMPFVISCPVDADLLKSSNWTRTNALTDVQYCEEGNAVAYKGEVYDIIRVNEDEDSGKAQLLKVLSTTSLAKMNQITMPGGGKKFKIVYDQQTSKFWTFTTPDTYKQLATWPRHDGIYKNIGVSCSLQRNKLYLMSSPDLQNWTVVDDDVFYDDDFFFHGFQYVDFAIDGDDLVAAMRLGAPESDGLPFRQHDANIISFFKVENFRKL